MSARFWISLGVVFGAAALLTASAFLWSRLQARKEAKRLRERSPKDTIEMPAHRGQDMRKTDHWNLS
jgi:hypothetical protein